MPKIHIEIYLASQMLQHEQGTFSNTELVERVRQEFGDTRAGVQPHASSHCVTNLPLHTTYVNNYLWRLDQGQYRCFDPAQDQVHPDRVGGRQRPDWQDVPAKYRWLLQPASSPPAEVFEPVPTFSWKINRAERSLQVRWLAPQQMVGPVLARRLGKAYHLGMIVDAPRDVRYARIDVPYVLWSQIEA